MSGYGCIILLGVLIGQGAVRVVSKNVPPYAIFEGDKVVKYCVSNKIINKFLKYDFSKLSLGVAEMKFDYLYENVNEENIDTILKELEE